MIPWGPKSFTVQCMLYIICHRIAHTKTHCMSVEFVFKAQNKLKEIKRCHFSMRTSPAHDCYSKYMLNGMRHLLLVCPVRFCFSVQHCQKHHFICTAWHGMALYNVHAPLWLSSASTNLVNILYNIFTQTHNLYLALSFMIHSRNVCHWLSP